MEMLLFLFLSISAAFMALKLILPKSHGKKKLPPGPPSIPFLLNLVWQRKSIFDVEPLLRQLHAEHGPIISVNIGSRPSIFIADRHVAHRALVQNGAAFADRPPAIDPNILFTCNQHNISSAPYGNFWRLLRRNLSSEILHPSRVKLFAPARRWALGILLEKLEAQREANEGVTVVVESFHYAMFCLLVLMCFGEKLEEKTIIDIQVIVSEMLLSFTKFPFFAFFPKITKLLFRKRWMGFLEMRRKLEEIFIPLIRARRDNDKRKKSFDFSYVDSILDVEIQEEEQERKLTEDEMVSICSEFLTAGTDTTATPLQWIMANLVKCQEVQARLFQEMEAVVGDERGEIQDEDLQRMPYLKAVVMEGLRRYPPGHFVLPHAVKDDIEFDGYSIPKGAEVNFLVSEIGWDESVWKEPMEFRPERFLEGGEGEGVDITGSREMKMIPFGAGRRMCPGYALGMLHLEYFLANLVWMFEWKAVEGEAVDMAEELSFTVVMKNPLRARIFPRRNKSTTALYK